MPKAEIGDARLHYQLSGAPEGEILVFSNSLGSNLHMWDKLLPWFEKSYRVLRYDTRGHGQSSVPPGPYTIAQLGGDVVHLIDHLGLDHVNVCGLSLGGMVAMWLGTHAPQRVRRLVLANTGARIGTPQMWDERVATVQSSGMASLATTGLHRWFTPGYREHHPDEMEIIRSMIGQTNAQGYASCCGVLRDTDLRHEVRTIEAPCLVITGTYDPATPPSDGLALHSSLRHSSYVELDASHLSAWERAEPFADAVLAFLHTQERNDE
jgi:3-oxoadipate enol-lactonase